MSNDKVSYVHEDVTFESFKPELAIPIPHFNKHLIADAHFALQTRLDSAPKHVGSISPDSPEDVRIYLDHIDVTSYFVRVLAEELNALDQDELSGAYSRAMASFIEYAQAMGTAYDGLIADLRKDSAKLAAVRPIGKLVSQIGNRNHGHKGHLHICNFLYSQIPAPEVRLSKVIALYNKDHSASPIAATKIERLTFSCGPSIVLDLEGWRRNRPVAKGAISLTMALQLHDPLEDEITLLKQQVDDLQHEITEAIDSIKESLSMNGPIRRTIVRIEATSDKSMLEIQSARRDLQSCEAQVSAQARTLDHIKTQVDAM